MIGTEIEHLIKLLSRLPGYGPRSARRAALHLLKNRESLMRPLSQALGIAADVIVECPQCHSAVRVGSKFCGECGTPMAKHCTNCNADLSATAKFCAECGTPANPPPA